MKRQEWEPFLNYLQEKQNAMFVDKRGQYATDDDVLKNFKQTAAMNHETPERSLWGFVSKHLIALKNMIDQDMDAGQNIFTYDQYEDKALDVYNYMALLLAIVKEKGKNRFLMDVGDTLLINNEKWLVKSVTGTGYKNSHEFADDTPTIKE